jgi:RNA polymerase sigma-70 factor (ECF subfamily)
MSTLATPGATTRRLKPEIEELFSEHSTMLYRTAYSMLGNSADAEDVLQSIFLRLLRRELPSNVENIGAYLYRAAVNFSLNVIRSRKRVELTGDAESLEVPADKESGSTRDAFQRVTDAIAELSSDDAQVLILRYIHNHTDAEIAKLLGVSRGTIAMRLFRSRLRLKKLLGEEK